MTSKKAPMSLTQTKVIFNLLKKKNRLPLSLQDAAEDHLPERLENQCVEAIDAKEKRKVIVLGTNLPTK